ncbi:MULTISPECIES: ATP-grasp domain-containing protein [unclassified Streptomyces]|uniref:ATP-grasp domain-containing protein n=1 Tax=unclassified Streptomyces TaxID=2593676 RepID=UPI003624B044
MTRPLVLIVSPGDETYRGYCLESVAADHDVVLLTGTEPSWEKPYIVDHAVTDLHDSAALLAAGLALAERHEIAGVLTWDEYALVPAATLAARLGLRTSPVSAMLACRDKGTTRRLLAQAGVPSARSVRVESLTAASAAADEIGYPVVLKPASHAASIGVIRVQSPEGLPDGWEFAAAGAGEQGPEGHGVLVEEYLDGPEISVECATRAGETTVLAVTRKELDFAPYFEETGHTVTADDPLLPMVAPLARQALHALGVTDGVQHVEMRLTPAGPRIIEVNARIGGDFIGRLVHLATGLDLPAIAAAIAADRAPDLTPTRTAAAAIRILYPPATGILTERHLPLQPPGIPGLHDIGWFRQSGDDVALPPDGDLDTARIGYLITAAPTLAQAEIIRSLAEQALVLRVEPARQDHHRLAL